MKILLRVVIGLIGVVVIVLGLKQFMRGARELAGTTAIQSPKMGETFTSPEHGYSHRIPKDWKHQTPPPSTADMIVAPKETGLASNMVTTIEPFAGSLAQYVDTTKHSLRSSVADAKILSDSEFVSESGLTGRKITLQNKIKDIDLQQTMYFFEGMGDKKIIVTCSSPAKNAAQVESIFDSCMKTFALSAQ